MHAHLRLWVRLPGTHTTHMKNETFPFHLYHCEIKGRNYRLGAQGEKELKIGRLGGIVYVSYTSTWIIILTNEYLMWIFISFSRSELPDRGQNDAAQPSQVHGEWRYWLCPQTSSHV